MSVHDSTRSSTLTIRIDPKMRTRIVKAAKEADQSLTDYVIRSCRLRMEGKAEKTITIKVE